MPESVVRRLVGRYSLLKPIGQGGMGTVWLARDEALRRLVAIKEVRMPTGLDHESHAVLCARLEREAHTTAWLRHPAIVTVLDVVTDDERPWIVMELLEARSLDQIIRTTGPLPPSRVAFIGGHVISALRAAHAKGVLHRDIKPANVLITPDGRVVLTDFGIATYDGATTLTQTGTFLGSPAYVAPEIARGSRATVPSDLWSLGATLYAAVEGRPPYDRDSALATIAALITEKPDPPRQAGPLRPVLEGLLQRNPRARMSVHEAARLLDELAPKWRGAARPVVPIAHRTNRLLSAATAVRRTIRHVFGSR